MKIELNQINPYVYHVRFSTRYDLTSTLLRFGEFIESPSFKKKIFTLREFKKWYMESQNKNKFTYYEDWSGYNIPSKELKPFYEGKFDPLSRKEKQFLKLFEDIKGEFYIIATFKRNRDEKETIKHEMTHALYSKNREYRKKVKEYFKDKDVVELKDFILKDYGKNVLIDEMNAYLVNDIKWLMKKKEVRGRKYTDYSRYLKKLYKEYKGE